MRRERDVAGNKAALEALAALFPPPAGVSRYWVDQETDYLVKHVGALTVGAASGRINVWPHLDGDDRDLGWLLGMAENTFRTKPTKAAGWGLRRQAGRTWWHCAGRRGVLDREG